MSEFDREDVEGDNARREESTGFRLLGTSAQGSIAYYRPESRTYVETTEDVEAEGGTESSYETERRLNDDSELGGVLAEVRDSVGWDELTDFARKFLPDEGGDREGGTESDERKNEGRENDDRENEDRGAGDGPRH